MNKTKLLGASLVLCSMVGFVAYASAPQVSKFLAVSPVGPTVGAAFDVSTIQSAASARGRAPTVKAYDVALQSLVPDGFGSFHQPTTVVEPALIDSQGLQTAPIGNAMGVAAPVATNTDCTLYGLDSKKPLPLIKLVGLMESGVSRLGATADVNAVRVRVQVYLNLSRDSADLKAQAISRLQADYASSPVVRKALAEAFDLTDLGDAGVNGYDPCGSPTAIGGGAFSQGPFANTFATINPVPIIVSKAGSVVEGQASF